MTLSDEIHFCPRCGAQLGLQDRFGARRPVCPACDWIYFPDPKVAAAGLVEQDGKVLLVRRANDPMRGLWTLPAGFVDAGEDPAGTVVRECLEETGLQVEVTGLLEIIAGQEHPRGAHFVIVYRARLLGGRLQAADDVDAAAFFPREALPELAFASTRRVLLPTKLYP
jgi:ADP-ribose pyrophosphatase YjhB (NUDIX family)